MSVCRSASARQPPVKERADKRWALKPDSERWMWIIITPRPLSCTAHSPLLPPAVLSPLRFTSPHIFVFLLHPPDSFLSLPSITASHLWLSLPLLIPFFLFFLFHGRISTALFNIHISIFIIPLRSTLTSKKKLPFSLARWIIIPSSVRPCQSINLTCHLLSFLSGSVKGWLPLLSLYLSLSLCVQIPRLSPPDWIIQFRCHLFHSWQRGLLCTLLYINCGSNRPTTRTHPPIRLLISLLRNATPFRFHIHFLSPPPFFFSLN